MVELLRPDTGLHSVLFVDDEPNVTTSLQLMFRKAPFRVVTANSGREALEVVRQTNIDVVVSDEQMPDMAGSALLAELRRTHPDMVRIILTGEASLESAIHAINDAAIFRFLRKPCSPEELLGCLNEALCAREGRRRVAAAENDVVVLRELARSFDRALAELFVVAQPVVCLSENTLFAYEILVRTREASLPHPGALFSAAETLGRVLELERAIRGHIAGHAPFLPSGTMLLVNLHPESLADPELLAANSPLRPFAPRITFEVTERSSLKSLERASEQVAALKAAGYGIAVDDLGAGYAGLTSIALLQPDIVKIDMELVRNIDASPTRATLISGIVSLCRALDVAVIAEGVETAAESAKLQELECDLLQGYYFGRPAAPFAPALLPSRRASQGF